MKLFVLFLNFSYILVICTCFNLETSIPIVKRGPTGSYFGYSVAEHQSVNITLGRVSHNWLLVGAPIGQNLQPGTNHSGALYSCPITLKDDDCIQVVTDGKRTVDSNQLTPPFPEEIKDGQWMGVSVRSQKPGGKVMVCAHRYIRRGVGFQWGQGLCYSLSQYLDYDDTWEPCKGRSVQREHEEYGYCQAGTSSLLLDDDTAVIGTPGVYTWRGTVYVFSVAEDYLKRDKMHYFGPHFEKDSPIDKYSYLGMSVTGGRFLSDTMSYAAGAPRGNSSGQVVIFQKREAQHGGTYRNNAIMDVLLVITGEQFASSFGYEVSSADLNGDGLPDLIVGAPFYFSREAGGAVYIYYNKNHCLTCSPPQKLTGTLESRFGFAISSLGDLNRDGFEDLAIGAPYEGRGVVYIYLGSAKGLDKEPSQVIKSSQIPSEPVTFGYSLSGGMDLDENGYPDLLVGAYEADTVVLLRARPIIDITTEIISESDLKNIDPSRHGCPKDPNSEFTCLSFSTCCNVMNTSANSLSVLYRIEAETFQPGRKFSRVWFGPDSARPSFSTSEVRLSRKYPDEPLRHCQDHIVYLKENTKDIQSPIRMKLSYTLVQQPPSFPRNRDKVPSLDGFPILNQQEAAKIVTASFQKDCGVDDICQSSLRTDVSLDLPPSADGTTSVLTLGTAVDLPLNVTITNEGESAYETQFFVQHPAMVSYNRIESESKQVFCQSFNKTWVACQVGNPLKSQASVQFQVKFDVKLVGDGTTDETDLNFIVFTNSTSTEINPMKLQRLTASVVKRAEISLRGSARPEQVFYGGSVRGESAMLFKDDIGTKVVHSFQAYNAGPWRVNNLEITISWPYQVANNKPQGKWLLYLDEQPTVEAISGGQCYIQSSHVNALKLEARPGLYDTNSQETTGQQENATMSELRGSNLRSRREVRIRSERVIDSEGRAHNVVNMNCMNGTAKCLRFKCSVFNLHAGQEAVIRVSARLWNSTLVEDYPRVSYVAISSRAELSLAKLLIQNTSDDVADVTTYAYPEILDAAESEAVALWVMIVAAVAGILILLLLILLLWKCGFFKRNRPDPTLTGNLLKANQDMD